VAPDDPIHCPAPRQHLDRAPELAGGCSATHRKASGHLVYARHDRRYVVPGSLWKLPLPVSGGFAGWTKALGDAAAFGFHRWIAQNVFIPLLPLIDPLVFLTELSLAISFILGFLVRPMGAIGMLYVAHLWLGLYLNPSEWPWLYIFLIFVQAFFVLDNAGTSLGLDAMLARAPFAPFVGDGALARFYRKIA